MKPAKARSISWDGSSQARPRLAARLAPGMANSVAGQAAGLARASTAGAGRVDKRKSPRYKCKGSVRVQAGGNAAASWATLADISMSGCYIEATSPYRVGTVLGLELEANGFKVEAGGQVRVAYPGLGMGIVFTRISEEDRRRLRELVHSISPVSGSGAALNRRPRVAEQLALPQPSSDLSAVANPGAALKAIFHFFEDRNAMGREEFLNILRKNR
jgi:hypothetical protein